jgi:hypothetical protein
VCMCACDTRVRNDASACSTCQQVWSVLTQGVGHRVSPPRRPQGGRQGPPTVGNVKKPRGREKKREALAPLDPGRRGLRIALPCRVRAWQRSSGCTCSIPLGGTPSCLQASGLLAQLLFKNVAQILSNVGGSSRRSDAAS